MSIRVLVADDQDLVRTGLRLILGTLDGIEVVGEARDGQEAVRLARELRPDVCLMDIRMPVLDGVEATRLLAGPGVEDPVAVVVITTFDLDEYVHGALLAGATGFLLKDAGPELLGEAIRAATPEELADTDGVGSVIGEAVPSTVSSRISPGRGVLSMTITFVAPVSTTSLTASLPTACTITAPWSRRTSPSY